MIVMKFGGTSVGNAQNIENVAEIIQSYVYKKPIVIVSAVAKITDKLIRLAHAASERQENDIFQDIKKIHITILKELDFPITLLDEDFKNLLEIIEKVKGKTSLETLDYIQSFGEQLSSKIVATTLLQKGVEAKAINAWDLGLVTTKDFGNAEPLKEAFEEIQKKIALLSYIPIITGFIGKTKEGKTTTLGRGGSDYSAAIIGNAIDAEEIQIWTDVDGILSTDPKLIPQAKTIPEVSFAEAAELAYFGAKVLHPKTMLPAMQKNIPVRILNSFNPKNQGTIITKERNSQSFKVKAIAVKKDVMLIDIHSTIMLGAYGFLSKIFSIFNHYKKSIDVIATSEVSVSLTIDNAQYLEEIKKELEELGTINVWPDQAIICIVGEGMREALEVPGDTFSLLSKHKIRVDLISQGASQVNITFLVEEKDVQKTLELLHQLYFEEQKAL